MVLNTSQEGAGGRKRILTPLVQESTPAIIARKLRDAIANGDFPPGSQLTEAGLAADLGVSRGPLREAMQRLTAAASGFHACTTR